MPPLPGLPEGIIAQVRPHLKETIGYVLATSGDRLDVQKREIQAIKNRLFKSLRPDDLAGLRLPPSWILGVLLCPGDSTDTVAAWASALAAVDRGRLRFYFLGGTDAGAAMRAWTQEGLGPVAYTNVSTWQHFHHRYGADHAIRVYQDHVWKRRA